MTRYTRMLIGLVALGVAASPVGVAQAWVPSVATTVNPPVADHSNPRVKLSYRRFVISNLDLTDVPLQGLQLDVYPLSMRWVRAGLEIEAGTGRASLNGGAFDIRYGMVGMSGGFQYPARITPFVEGRFVGGIMGGSQDGEVTLPGTTVAVSGLSGATWITGRGLDFGAEIFASGRAYVSASIGWLHSTWGGVDYPAMLADPYGAIRYKELSNDGFTFKLGLGV